MPPRTSRAASDSPAAAASVCTTQPAVMPSVAATPARNPPAAPRAAMYAMSGPGVTLSSNPASDEKAEVMDAGHERRSLRGRGQSDCAATEGLDESSHGQSRQDAIGSGCPGISSYGCDPARLAPDPLEPVADSRIHAPVDADLVVEEEVAAQRQIGDRQPVARRRSVAPRRDARRARPTRFRRGGGIPPATAGSGSLTNVRMKRYVAV